MTKQSEAVTAYFIGHDPGQEQRRHPTMGRLDEGIQDPIKDDPVRHERLAAIGKNGTQIRLHKKRMTFYFENLSDWKHKCIEPEMTQFSPIN